MNDRGEAPALMRCEDCGGLVSIRAKECVHCGAPNAAASTGARPLASKKASGLSALQGCFAAVGCLFLGAVVLVVLLAPEGADAPVAPAPTEPATSSEAEPGGAESETVLGAEDAKQKPVGMNQAFLYDGMIYRVNQATWVPSFPSPSGRVVADASFLVLTVVAINEEDAPRGLVEFTLRDESGATHEVDVEASRLASEAWQPDARINPGVGKVGLLFFDVQPDRDYKLVLQGPWYFPELRVDLAPKSIEQALQEAAQER